METWKVDRLSADTCHIPCKSGVMFGPVSRGEIQLLVAPTKNVPFAGDPITIYHSPNEPEKKGCHDMDIDVIVACTGYRLQFDDWLKVPAIHPHPRMWYKHCFPPDQGHKIAFLGFARPHQGGIPQCAEMLARVVGLLLTSETELPPDYDQLALQEGNQERECFHQMPHYEPVVDFHAFMMSVAKLVGCCPQLPLTPGSYLVKHWTFPLWPYFFRARGPGRKPEVLEKVLSQFGRLDALAPMPLLLVEILCTLLMPVVNALSLVLNPCCYLWGCLSTSNSKKTSLPWAYKFRMSKAYFLYGNLHEQFDVRAAMSHVLAGISMIVLILLCSSFCRVCRVGTEKNRKAD